MDFQYVTDFAKKHNQKWDNIVAAEKLTRELVEKIKGSFDDVLEKMFSSDIDLVVFGSIARNECSKKSDVDWTLLIDGQTRPEQYTFGQLIADKFEKAELQEPGSSGMFGQITFGHDLIHYIGGEDDTNHNTSRRILMLLESDKIVFGSDTNVGTAYDRVLRGILNQYVQNDSSYRSTSKNNVPRFLLNDVIRFWRTMCVDFAYKQKEQQGKKWALRNVKLRISRKLIYVKGFLMCFSCYKNGVSNKQDVENHLVELAAMKPLDVVIKICTEAGVDERHLVDLFTAYDKFLALLNDDTVRGKLERIKMLKAYESEVFINARQIAYEFQDALTKIFITEKSKLQEFSIEYGIF